MLHHLDVYERWIEGSTQVHVCRVRPCVCHVVACSPDNFGDPGPTQFSQSFHVKIRPGGNDVISIARMSASIRRTSMIVPREGELRPRIPRGTKHRAMPSRARQYRRGEGG